MIAFLCLIALSSVSCRNRREIAINNEYWNIRGNDSFSSFVREMLKHVEQKELQPKSIFVVFYDSEETSEALNETFNKIKDVCLQDKFINETQLIRAFVEPFAEDDSEPIRKKGSLVVSASSGEYDGNEEHFSLKSEVHYWSNFNETLFTNVLEKCHKKLAKELEGEN
ncbi:hypothetical protein ACOME3_004120 [Neoechinorhynchus agilis]